MSTYRAELAKLMFLSLVSCIHWGGILVFSSCQNKEPQNGPFKPQISLFRSWRLEV